MKKFFAGLLALLLLVSCSTVEYVYVPVEPEPIDIRPTMTTVFDTRPDNSQMVIITDIRTTFDIIDNSIMYQEAWERWEAYAGRLETYISDVAGILKKGDSN